MIRRILQLAPWILIVSSFRKALAKDDDSIVGSPLEEGAPEDRTQGRIHRHPIEQLPDIDPNDTLYEEENDKLVCTTLGVCLSDHRSDPQPLDHVVPPSEWMCRDLRDDCPNRPMEECLQRGTITHAECPVTCGTCEGRVKTILMDRDHVDSFFQPHLIPLGTLARFSNQLLDVVGTDYGIPQEVVDTQPLKRELLDRARQVAEYIAYLPPELQQDCRNLHKNCMFWAATGECEANQEFMHVDCRPACFRCSDTNILDRARQVAEYIAYLPPELQQDCRNLNKLCIFWAATGECEANQEFMHVECRPACFRCSDTNILDRARQVAEYMTRLPPQRQQDCRNLNKLCIFWAATGECEANQGFMYVECRPACFRCSVTNDSA